MVLILEILLFISIMLLTLTIWVHKGNITFTIQVKHIEEAVQKVDETLSDLSAHYSREISKEEQEYYDQSTNMIRTLNEILSGNFDDLESGEVKE